MQIAQDISEQFLNKSRNVCLDAWGEMMKNQEILNYIDNKLIDNVFNFCIGRTKDNYEAQELCSDIMYALVKTAHTEGEITDLYPWIWQVAGNTWLEFMKHKKQHQEVFCECDSEKLLALVPAKDEDISHRLLEKVYRQIAFLTRTYREVMIQYYIDGLTTADIARIQNTTETNVRQKLLWARGKVKNGVKDMEQINGRPLVFYEMNYIIWGYGRPEWGDPRKVGIRTLSKHIIWLCRNKPMGAAGIAEQLNVPTAYIEEELEVLTGGTNGEYGLLRRTGNGRYAINFILLSETATKKAAQLYIGQMPKVSRSFCDNVERILAERYFADYEEPSRPFSVFGHVAADGTQCAGGDCICPMNEEQRLYEVSDRFPKKCFEEKAQETAKQLDALIRRSVPKHLLGEWRFVCKLAKMQVFESVEGTPAGQGILTPPVDGIFSKACCTRVV